jgi:hypothetical protein
MAHSTGAILLAIISIEKEEKSFEVFPPYFFIFIFFSLRRVGGVGGVKRRREKTRHPLFVDGYCTYL